MPDLHRPRALGVESPRDTTSAEPTPGQRPSESDQEIDLGRYSSALGRRWKLILAGAFVGGATAFAAASARPILYEGVTSLLVVPPARPSPNAGSPSITPATFKAVLESQSIAAEVVQETGLNHGPHNLTPQSFLERALVVEDERGANIVRVKVRLREPSVAADASRRVAAKAISLTRQLTEQEGSSIQQQLGRHLTDASQRLAAAERALLAYQQEAQIELLKEDSQALLNERGELLKLLISIESENARLRAAEEEIKKQERFLSVRRALGAEEALRRTDQTTDVLDPSNAFINPVYQSLDYQIATSRAKLAGLDQQRRQLVEVRHVDGKELTKLSELYRRQIELARLQTTFDLAKRVHGELAVRFEESRTQALGNSSQLQVVSDAIPPDRPVARRRGQWSALGFITGLLAAGLIALLLESRGVATRE